MFESNLKQRNHKMAILGCALLLLATAIAPAAGDGLYAQGTEALDRREWQQAAELFGEVVERGEDRVDAALYWRAYSLRKLGRTDQALDALHRLEGDYPNSRWLDDARDLRAELGGADPFGDDDLRLMALASLLESSPERALPLLEKFLAGDHSAAAKENALFLAMHSGNAEALEIAVTIAQRDENPEMQAAAVRGLGIAGGARSREMLTEIYKSSESSRVKQAVLEAFMIGDDVSSLLAVAKTEKSVEMRIKAVEYLGVTDSVDELTRLYETEPSVEVKSAILSGYMIAGANDHLLAAAKGESQLELRAEAIQLLGVSDGGDDLWELYQTESSSDLRRRIIEGLAIGDGSDRLLEIARTDSDPEMRAAAIRGLGISGVSSPDLLVEIYRNDEEPALRRAALEALFLNDEFESLIVLARAEQDRARKREIVEYLAISGSKAAAEYLVELLDE